MKFTLLAATIILTMTACGKPNQALPEQEKENFERIMSQQSGSGDPAASSEADPDGSAGTDAPQE